MSTSTKSAARSGTYQWKWTIAGVISLVIVANLGLWAVIARLATSDFMLNPPAPLNTYSNGLGNGFMLGFMFAVTLPGIVISLPTLLMELRTWRLLLDYHDRLQQAGLLPGESGEKMESTDLPLSGS
jgi:hypothetical protein